jgi:asparagine synthase (glutamine-hydrolysing)
MCGFAGFLDFNKLCDNHQKNLIAMSSNLIHRGPNDSGLFIDSDLIFSVAHRRLSILDLSKAGHQPMISKSGRFIIAFNGEIYNHIEIRKELFNFVWKSKSDTETLLEAFSCWGIPNTLKKIRGMFAAALWDKEKQKLYLIRDRVGEKPLYYGYQNGIFIFGSELKALKAHSFFENDLNINSIGMQFTYGYIPSPYSIYNKIYKLEPGKFLSIDINQFRKQSTFAQTFWSLKNTLSQSSNDLYKGSFDDASRTIESILSDAVNEQMISDVPMGAFLSSGIDSSLIVALMQKNSKKNVKTFSIGFNDSNFDESSKSKEISKYLGTEHFEYFFNSDDILNLIPSISLIFDEPFSDVSQMPSLLISKFAKKQVGVVLTGDGGDEIFGGYNKYKYFQMISKISKFIPQKSLYILNEFFKKIPDRHISRLLNIFGINDGSQKFRKFSSALDADFKHEIYFNLASHSRDSLDLVLGSKIIKTILHDQDNWPLLNSPEELMMYLDIAMFLPDDILVKVDRVTMSQSLESRAPFLDTRLINFSSKLPLDWKIKNSNSKIILKDILSRYLPKSYFSGPKKGFSIPINDWLRGPLVDWVDDILNEKSIKDQGFLNDKAVAKKWADHRSGKVNCGYELWDILMFQSWLASR